MFKICQKIEKKLKKGGTGPYLGFLQKRPKNRVFLMFFDDFTAKMRWRLTEETRVVFGGYFWGFL
jgi:hypothetical protein